MLCESTSTQALNQEPWRGRSDGPPAFTAVIPLRNATTSCPVALAERMGQSRAAVINMAIYRLVDAEA